MTTTNTVYVSGIKAVNIIVEVEVRNGIGIHVIGIQDANVKELLLRTVTAMQSHGFRIPGKSVVINFAPGSSSYRSSAFDLPAMLALLAETAQVHLPDLDKWVITGEVGLDGSVRGVRGCVQAVQLALERGDIKGVIIPKENADEVACVFANAIPVYGVRNMLDAFEVIQGGRAETAWEEYLNKPDNEESLFRQSNWDILSSDTQRALVIAAAGGHNLLLVGAPGSGKATAARELVGLLPHLSVTEQEELAAIYSAADKGSTRKGKLCEERPFRSPHNTCSMSALLGGGSGDSILPGEVTLAHNGVLFIDDFVEAPKCLQEAMRVPAIDHKVVISRLRSKVEMPADCQIVLATNPCPCGYYGEGERCTCTPTQRRMYMEHLSPSVLSDVTRMQHWCHPLEEGATSAHKISREDATDSVRLAREKQRKRFAHESFRLNDRIPANEIERYCRLNEGDVIDKAFLDKLITRLNLSARSYSSILRIARTIADLDGSELIGSKHLAEASCYQFLNRLPYSAE